jgi:hypothetical protein
LRQVRALPGDDLSGSRARLVGAWTVLPRATSSSMRAMTSAPFTE